MGSFYILAYIFIELYLEMSGGEFGENRREIVINIAHGGMQVLFQFQIRAVLTQACTANML